MSEHEVTFEERSWAPKFSAACSCGWTGPTRHVRVTAEADGALHVETVAALAEGRAVRKVNGQFSL